MHQRDAQEAWTRLARRAVRKVNAGWWLEAFAPLAMAAGLVGFCIIFFLRSKWIEIDPATAGWTGGAILLCLALSAWAFVKNRFRDIDEGFVMLDARMKLRNALTTARRGHGPWPDLPMEPRDGLHWKWQWVLSPFLIPSLLVVAALLLPVSEPEEPAAKLVVKPPALEQIENAIETLEDEKAVDETDLQRIREQLESLQDVPAEEWYSHNNLEALDTMRSHLAANIQKLESNLGKADSSLAAFEKFRDSLPQSAKERLQREYEEALKGMSGGGLRASEALRDALSKIDPSKLGQLSQEQMKQLRDALGKNRGACSECLGGGEGELSPDEQALRELLGENGQGSQPGNGNKNGNGTNPGNGGINRGPGHAPTRLGEETDLGTNKMEGIESEDLSRSTLGNMIDEKNVEHDIDKSKVGPRAGGTANEGSGGDAVWTNELLPEERKTLERFFE